MHLLHTAHVELSEIFQDDAHWSENTFVDHFHDNTLESDEFVRLLVRTQAYQQIDTETCGINLSSTTTNKTRTRYTNVDVCLELAGERHQ